MKRLACRTGPSDAHHDAIHQHLQKLLVELLGALGKDGAQCIAQVRPELTNDACVKRSGIAEARKVANDLALRMCVEPRLEFRCVDKSFDDALSNDVCGNSAESLVGNRHNHNTVFQESIRCHLKKTERFRAKMD